MLDVAFSNYEFLPSQEKLDEYVKQNERKLAETCSMFVESLVEAMSCFPQSLGWVIARAYHIVKDAGASMLL